MNANWGLIREGATFESLMQCLVRAEDPAAHLFGRAGKDLAMDALSSDGARVYQAKFGATMTMNEIIASAKKEVEKIVGYRKQGEKHWKPVREWTLVTNAAHNVWDEDRWNESVVRLLDNDEIGIKVSFWAREELEGRLADHPEIKRAFFGGENRCLLYLREAANALARDSIGNVYFDMRFLGRAEELRRVDRFLQDPQHRILLVHAPHGLGRSRFLYEAMEVCHERGMRTYWGLHESMVASVSWFDAIERPGETVLFVDDCADVRLLGQIREQLSAHELASWKVVVSVAEEWHSEVANEVATTECCTEVQLRPLYDAEVREILERLPEGKTISRQSGAVASVSGGNPAWVALLVASYRQDNSINLSDASQRVAQAYLRRCLEGLDAADRKLAETVFRHLCLWGKLNEDMVPHVKTYLAAQGVSGNDYWRIVDLLIDRGVAYRREFPERTLQVPSTIIQYHVLSAWLFIHGRDGYSASPEGKTVLAKIVSGELPFPVEAMTTLAGLSRSYLPLDDSGTFLAPVFKACESALDCGNAQVQYAVLDLVDRVGRCDVERALCVVTKICNTDASASRLTGSLGQMEITHGVVLSSVPKVLQNLALSVRGGRCVLLIVDRLVDLFRLEKAGACEPAQGEGAKTVLQRLMTLAQPANPFAREAFDRAMIGLDNGLDDEMHDLMVTSVFRMERMSFVMSGSYEMTLHRRIVFKGDGSQDWERMTCLRKRLREILTTCTDERRRCKCWGWLAESHSSIRAAEFNLSQTKDSNDACKDILRDYGEQLVDDLRFCNEWLQRSGSGMSFEEKNAMRGIWSRHLWRGKDSSKQDQGESLAFDCEEHYARSYPFRIQELFRSDMDGSVDEVRKWTVNELLQAESVDEISAYFDAARDYLKIVRQGDCEADFCRSSELGCACADGIDLHQEKPMSQFVRNVLQSWPHEENPLSRMFVEAVCRRAIKVSKSCNASVRLFLEEIIEQAANKADFLSVIYRLPHPNGVGPLTAEEFEVLSRFATEFTPWDLAMVLAVFLPITRERLLAVFERRLEALPEGQPIGNFIDACVRAWQIGVVRRQLSAAEVPLDWILRMLVKHQGSFEILADYDFVSLSEAGMLPLSCERLLEVLTPGGVFPHDLRVKAVFGQVTESGLRRLCDYCCGEEGDAFVLSYQLPQFIAALDGDAAASSMYVCEKIREQGFNVTFVSLYRLARLATAWDDASPQWEKLARPILRMCERSLAREDRERLYADFMPRMRGDSWNVGEIPQGVVDRLDAAQKKWAEVRENPEDDFYGYRKWRLKFAESEYERARVNAEEERYGRA